MVELIQPPDPRALLPPLLACLPLAFVSPRPPPALLPLLSPILRQRVQFLATGQTLSASDSWLRLLSWNAEKGEELQSLVDGMTFEPHPVSGEIELPDDMPVVYKRIDEETLNSRIVLPDYCLTAVYVWCPNDEQGGGPGWRVNEVLPRGGGGSGEDEDGWTSSIGEANTLSKERLVEDALRAAEKDELAKRNGPVQEEEKLQKEEEDDDAAYWAQYDATPGATPATKTPAPNPVSSLENGNGTGAATDSYFARYGDVQPAMDSHDPEEEQSELGPSSLNGDLLASLLQRQTNPSDSAEQEQQPARTNGFSPGTVADEETAMSLNHPRPSTDSSASSDAVARLEQEAESRSSSEVGVRQHISSNIKSLFRLAKSTGIPRAEFQSLVQTELELLSVSDE